MFIKEKAFDKIYSIITTLGFKIEKKSRQINSGLTGGISMDQLKSVKKQLESELEIWNYVLSLIEKNDKL